MADPSDIGELLSSPSAAFMKLVDCDHLNDFEVVCEYLSEHAMEVRGTRCSSKKGRVRVCMCVLL